LDTTKEVIAVLTQVLGLPQGARALGRDTRLLGAIPELDSMAVATVLTTLEERLAFTIDDDEIDGSAFATVGTLADFVDGKVRR
jgi:acyl carrier protein